MKNNLPKLILRSFLVICLLIPTTCKKLERIMMVSTGDATNILSSSADAPGEIIELGEGADQHGHYYGKEPNLNASDMKTQLGPPSANGGFTSQLSNLESGTLYYIKAYLSNGTETVFGKEKSFKTLQPTLSPVFVSSVIEDDTPTLLEMTYNLTLANIVPASSAFVVQVNSAVRAVSKVAIYGAKVQLTLSSPVISGDVVTVAYTKPGSNPLQTDSGGQAATIEAQSVTNNVGGTIPVYVSSVIEDGTPTLLEMTYNLTLANIVPASSAFVVQVNSAARAVSTVAISGAKVQLTLSSLVISGDVVNVAYIKPGSNPLQTDSGGQAATIEAQSVANNVGGTIPVYVSSVIENTTPTLLEMTYNLTLANIVPASSAFVVQVNSAARAVSTVAISGAKVQLTLSSLVISGDVVTVAYTKPGSNPLQTATGYQAASITAQSVTNNVGGTIPEYVSSVIENTTPTLLEMTYSLTLEDIVPATNAFSVLVNGGSNPVSGVAISDSKIQLTLTTPVTYGDLVTVAYTKPGSNPIQTPAGEEAASITFQSVTNNVIGIPSILTTLVSNITLATASSGGEIFDDGGASIAGKGVCWGTSANPTIADPHSEDGSGIGTYASFLSPLVTNTTYFVRAYATNSKGTGYGNELIFKTFTGTVKDVENNSYYTVTIGSQVWMAQNLIATRYNDGVAIPLVTDSADWISVKTPAYCWYNNDEAEYKNTYGALYNLYAAETDKVCPDGWHVPSGAEWGTLTTFLGGLGEAGGKLKEKGFIHWLNPNTGATNETGFTALPAGLRTNTFTDLGRSASFWSTMSGGSLYSLMQYNAAYITQTGFVYQWGRSIRCLED